MLNPPPSPSNTANEVSDLAVHGWVGFFEFFSFFIFCECVDRLSHSQQVNVKWRHAKPGNNNGDIASSSRQIHVKKVVSGEFLYHVVAWTNARSMSLFRLFYHVGVSRISKDLWVMRPRFSRAFFSIGSSDYHNYRMHQTRSWIKFWLMVTVYQVYHDSVHRINYYE